MAANLEQPKLGAKLSNTLEGLFNQDTLHTLLHQIRELDEIPALDQAHNIITRLDGLNARLDGLDARLDAMDRNQIGITKALTDITTKLGQTNTRIGNLDARIGNLEEVVRLGFDNANQKFQILNSNNVARVQNSNVGHRDNSLTPLYNIETGQDIPGFPVKPSEIDNILAADIDPILEALGSNTSGGLARRRNRLRALIGLRVGIA